MDVCLSLIKNWKKQSEMSNRAVFLDRDGTVNVEVSYLNNTRHLRIMDGVPEAIIILKDLGFKIIIVTNQSGVARGYIRERTLKRIHAKLRRLLRKNGTDFDAVFYCPYYKSARKKRYKKDSSHRKPNPGMIEKARRIFDIDLDSSYMLGDRRSDIGAGKNSGCTSILVKTGYGSASIKEMDSWPWKPDYIADDLMDAVVWIKSREDKKNDKS